MGVLLGAIADDFTGATDLCNTLQRRGMRTVQLIGVPPKGASAPEAEAFVIALKTRTVAAAEAVRKSLDALAFLQAAGARQIFFKYCSTFDSTDEGNIGPVAEALLSALGADFTLFCPAFPETGRTIYKGHLFVGEVLLSQSGMRDHPLTPMRDPNLVRVLERQCRFPVGLVPYESVAEGAEAIANAFSALKKAGVRHAVVDALFPRDLEEIAVAAADFPLVTGGSGIARGLPENLRRKGLLGAERGFDRVPAVYGLEAVLSGSCSEATAAQVAFMQERAPAFAIDPLAAAEGRDLVAEAIAWARPRLPKGPILIFSTAPPQTVAAVQKRLGREAAGALVEGIFAGIALGLVACGVRSLLVAGGETAGAVVGSLGITALAIGPEIDPGVPWTLSLGEPAFQLALKSGNFGKPDFFLRAFSLLSKKDSR